MLETLTIDYKLSKFLNLLIKEFVEIFCSVKFDLFTVAGSNQIFRICCSTTLY